VLWKESVEPSELALKPMLNTRNPSKKTTHSHAQMCRRWPKSRVPTVGVEPAGITTAQGQREKTRKDQRKYVSPTPSCAVRLAFYNTALPIPDKTSHLPHPTHTRASSPSLLSICHRPVRLRPLAAPSLLRIPISRRRRLHRNPLARLPAERLHVGPVFERLREVADAARDVLVALYRERNDGL
jgi:hypothetical protein